jgi:hypothetical protein
MSDKPRPQADCFRRLRRLPWAATIVAVGAVLTGLAAWKQAIDTLLLFLGVKPNALQLARDDNVPGSRVISHAPLASPFPLCGATQRSLHGTSMPGAGAVHHIRLGRGGMSALVLYPKLRTLVA